MAVFDLADALPANQLVTWHLAQEAPKVLALHAHCDLHQVHLATTQSIASLELLTPMYSVHTQTNFASCHFKFIIALDRLLAVDQIDIVYHRSPRDADVAYARWVMENTLLRWC